MANERTELTEVKDRHNPDYLSDTERAKRARDEN